jgi:diguanylate cyclase (GGDEF)-like protein
MRTNKRLADFVARLSENVNTLEVSKQAFLCVADTYRFGEVRLHYHVDHPKYQVERDEYNAVFHLDMGAINEKMSYVMERNTGEGGVMRFSVIGLKGARAWSEEEQVDIEMMLTIYMWHIARYRLISVVEKSVSTDYMTTLPNTNGYLEYGEMLRKTNTLSSFNSFYFNLKGFGLVNLKYGKTVADEILKKYALKVKKYLVDDEIVARLGGDNFVALIHKERTREFLSFIEQVVVHVDVNDHKQRVEIPAIAGICEISDPVNDLGDIISQASVALNTAKNVTKKPYMFVTDDMNKKAIQDKEIRMHFKEALQNGEFKVYYQPKVETDEYRIVGAEALVRWVRDGEVISPSKFIPLIEADGSVCELDLYMLAQVCNDIRIWLSEGVEPVRTSVNMSRKHLSNPNFPDQIIDMIDEFGIDHKYIEIELTETASDEEQGLLNTFMTKMREQGIKTAIDDFGTGVSSFAILRSFPVDVLKVDKSFIDSEFVSDNDAIVISNIVKMANELNLEVITEGVERWKQVIFLRQIGCKLIQGYLFDRPMPYSDFTKRLKMKKYDKKNIKDY